MRCGLRRDPETQSCNSDTTPLWKFAIIDERRGGAGQGAVVASLPSTALSRASAKAAAESSVKNTDSPRVK